MPGLASHLDVLPTVLDLSATEAEGAFVGYSLFDLPADRRLMLMGGGGVHALQGDVRCWDAGPRGECLRAPEALYGEFPTVPVENPELASWAVRTAAVSLRLGRTNALFPGAPSRLSAAAGNWRSGDRMQAVTRELPRGAHMPPPLTSILPAWLRSA